MKHRGDRTTDAERNGRSQETVERQAAVWINSERADTRESCRQGGRERGNRWIGAEGLGAVIWEEVFQVVDIYLFNTSVVIIHV